MLTKFPFAQCDALLNNCIVGDLDLQNALHDFCDILYFRQCNAAVDNINSQAFTREKIFEAASQGNTAELNGLLDYLRVNNKQLTSPEFTGKWEGSNFMWPICNC